MTEPRAPQLAYSDLQHLMLDEDMRRAKAAKIARILQHFLGTDSLAGLVVADVGCSAGIMSSELQRRGARVLGFDIDTAGLAKAAERFGTEVTFVTGDSERLPLADAAVDVVICNHVYEHVVDADRLFVELRRVVKPDGVLYLGLANKYGVIEPHYKLPFLSWIPRRWAHRYVRASGRASHYHEQFRHRGGLRRLCAGLRVWDYTYAVMASPEEFAAGDVVPGWSARVPPVVWRLSQPIFPTFIWLATPGTATPRGPVLPVPPRPVPTPPG